MASTINLYIDQGSDFHTEMILQNDDGSVIDLSGYTIYSQFRKSFQSSQYFSFECSIVGAPVLGEITLVLPGSVSTDIPPGRYLYDVEIVDAINEVQVRVIEGLVILTPEITRVTIV